MTSSERRDSPRQQATVKLTLQSHDLKEFQGLYTENVGKGGIFVRSRTLLPLGEKVRFEILCRGREKPLIGEAVVTWVRESDPRKPQELPGMGLQFISLADESAALFTQMEELGELPIVVEPESLSEEEPMILEEEIQELSETQDSGAAFTGAAMQASTSGKKPNFINDLNSMLTLPTSFSVADTVIGIDLGTSNSCVSVIHQGQPYVIPTENQERTVPSVISFTKNGSILVGKPAKDQLCIDPKNTVYGAKRFIGRPFNSPIVQSLKGSFPYELIPGEKGQVSLNLRGEVVNLETISSHLLNYLKLIAQEFVELEVTKAVITVPAYYNDNQRQAVKEAGRMAGLDVQRIVNEPTAAALAYGFNRGLKTRILVYDLGGGTFDISILELQGNSFSVVACGGNNFLGGEDFDNVITEYLISTFEKENGVTLAKDRIVHERIKQGAEFAKRMLSDVTQTTVNIPYLKTIDNQNVKMQIQLTRETLNRITKHLIDRTLQICDEVIYNSGLKKAELEEIVLRI
jgi:molecular chaperone DnaK